MRRQVFALHQLVSRQLPGPLHRRACTVGHNSLDLQLQGKGGDVDATLSSYQRG